MEALGNLSVGVSENEDLQDEDDDEETGAQENENQPERDDSLATPTHPTINQRAPATPVPKSLVKPLPTDVNSWIASWVAIDCKSSSHDPCICELTSSPASNTKNSS